MCIASLFMSRSDVYAAALRLGEVVAVVLEPAGVGAPVFVHFDEELEEDFLLQEVFNVLAGLTPDPFQGSTGPSYDDAFLAVPFAINHRRDTHDVFFFEKGFHLYFDGVRDLFVVVKKYLLAYDLVDKEALGLIGQLVLREERRSDRQSFFDCFEELVHSKVFLRRDREDLGFGQLVMPEGDEVIQGILGREVYLIDNKEHAGARGSHLFDFVDEVGVAVDGVLWFSDVQEHVGIHEGRAGELEHLSLELVARREDTGCIGINHLIIIPVDDAHDTMPGRLRL